MALTTIIKFCLTWGIGWTIFIFITPIINTVAYHSGLWYNMPPAVLAYEDELYLVWIAMIAVIPIVLAITAIREAEQRARET